MTNDEIEIIIRLQRQGFGYRRIAALTNIAVNTVKSYCKRHPVNVIENDTPSDAFCRQCGKPIFFTPHRKAKQYCSDKCRMAWWNSHRDQVNRKAYRTVICEYCGSSFEVYGAPKRKFCSPTCAAASRNKAVEV